MTYTPLSHARWITMQRIWADARRRQTAHAHGYHGPFTREEYARNATR